MYTSSLSGNDTQSARENICRAQQASFAHTFLLRATIFTGFRFGSWKFWKLREFQDLEILENEMNFVEN